jgi:hypothetical protein
MIKWLRGLWCKMRGHQTKIAQCPVTGIKVNKCDTCGTPDHNNGMSFS